MVPRLDWLRQQPASWVDWGPLRGGLEGHAALRARYPAARCHVVEAQPLALARLRQALGTPWWHPNRWRGTQPVFESPAAGSVDLVWANMQLHGAVMPQALMQQWHGALAEHGILMFSTFGPDTLRELRALYAAAGWAPPAQDFADMHDVGDLLVQAGFSDPVMDVERIVLTFADAPRLLRELRELGRNLHPGRFTGLRGRAWQRQLLERLTQRAQPDGAAGDGVLSLSFEVVYGHAVKGPARVTVAPETAIGLDDMRQLLRRSRAVP